MVKGLSTNSTSPKANNNKSDEAAANNTRNRLEKFLFIILPLTVFVGASLWYGHQVGASSLATVRDYYNQMQQQVIDLSAANTTIWVQQVFDKTTSSLPSTTTNSEGSAPKPPKPTTHRREKEKEQPMNIVIFYADDWTMNVMGKLNPRVITPHIDHMADKGVLFTNNCVTTSMCWISRASFFTGLYAAVHGESEPSSNKMFESRPWNQTLFPLLKSAGYYTGKRQSLINFCSH